MEVVVIDKATFERMLSGFEIFAEKVERLCREQEDLGENSSHRQGDFREDALGIRDFRGKGGTALPGTGGLGRKGMA